MSEFTSYTRQFDWLATHFIGISFHVENSCSLLYPWEICDAPDKRLLGRVFRGTDLVNFPPTFMPNGTVFQHRKKGHLQVFWDGILLEIQSLDDSVPVGGLKT